MSIDNNDEYKQLFIEEAKEHIETLTKSLLMLEKDPQNQEVINMLFRSAHTLKGTSGMMGFKDFQELTHAMEDIFDDMRKGKKPSSTLVSTLLECVDSFSTRLEQIQNKIEEEINVATLKQKLQKRPTLDRTAPGSRTKTKLQPKKIAATEVSLNSMRTRKKTLKKLK